MEYLKPKQAVTGRVILQLHGGGYIGPMKNIYRRFAVKYSQISFGADVLTPDYRVAPEHPYPAALEDAVYAYRWLLEEKKYQPSQIVVAGDSAGGGLALALCLYAKDHGLPLPAGIITMSPWTDVSLSGASYEENYTIDPLFGNSKENMLYQCSYIGNANPKNPYLSPLFGDFEGFPPMLMQVGAYEVLLDDTRAAAKKARAEGVKVRCSVYDGMFHVFQMGLDLIPESREAWEEVAEYLRIIYRSKCDKPCVVGSVASLGSSGLCSNRVALFSYFRKPIGFSRFLHHFFDFFCCIHIHCFYQLFRLSFLRCLSLAIDYRFKKIWF